MTDSTTTHLVPADCPSCGHNLDAATAVNEDAIPKSGDLTICAYCTAWLVFTDPQGVRIMTEDEALELPDDVLQMLQRARAFLRRYQELRESGHD